MSRFSIAVIYVLPILVYVYCKTYLLCSTLIRNIATPSVYLYAPTSLPSSQHPRDPASVSSCVVLCCVVLSRHVLGALTYLRKTDDGLA